MIRKVRKEVEDWDSEKPSIILGLFQETESQPILNLPSIHSAESRKGDRRGWGRGYNQAGSLWGRGLRARGVALARRLGGCWGWGGACRAKASCQCLRNRRLTPEVLVLWTLSRWTAAAAAAAAAHRR